MEVRGVPGEVQHRIADDDVDAPGLEARMLEALDPVAGRVVRRARSRDHARRHGTHRLDRLGVRIAGEDLVPGREEVVQVAPAATARVQDRVPRNDATALELVEEVDVDAAERGDVLVTGHGTGGASG